jgi:RNA polymerase sigma-70 factor (ECF subfamily)
MKGTEPDTPRFEELALPHLKALYRLAFRLTAETAAAEDLVQETYLKAFQSFASLRSTGSIRPWLFQILSRLATDRLPQRPPRSATGRGRRVRPLLSLRPDRR